MTQFSSKKMTDYFQAGHKDIQFIFAKVNQLKKINQRIADYLPKNLVKSCQVAQIKHHKIILLVENGSVATQIRFEAAQLIAKCQQDPLLKDIKEIECKVNPKFNPFLRQPISQAVKNPFEKRPFISQETAKIIQGTAETLSDPTLRKIMQRIATRTSSCSNDD